MAQSIKGIPFSEKPFWPVRSHLDDSLCIFKRLVVLVQGCIGMRPVAEQQMVNISCKRMTGIRVLLLINTKWVVREKII